jgi:hypothetical protein
MKRLVWRCAWLLATVSCAPFAHAQLAMTVTGRVTANGRGIEGASVRVADLGISVSTDAEGRYSFIIPSASVRGQTVSIVARSVRLPVVTRSLTVRGGSVVQDFDLTPAARSDSSPTITREPQEPPNRLRPLGNAAAVPPGDSLAPDIWGMLAMRHAELVVRPPATPGASGSLTYRGVRSAAATPEPLIVVNGIPLTSSDLRDPGFRHGFGGFDYGHTLDDLDPTDISTTELLEPAMAMQRFGGRGSNGALVITTRGATAVSGWEFTVAQRMTAQGAGRLPALQDRYGQGSSGQFSFFDGRGGGLNDGVAESWGPPLDGRPLTQASLTEAGRPDVRHWLPGTAESNLLAVGSKFTTNATANYGGPSTSLRATLRGERSSVDPGAPSLSRIGGSLNLGRNVGDWFTARAYASGSVANAEQRAVAGFDEANPFVALTHAPRQVSLGALADGVRDANGRQINWIYTSINNPFFTRLENDNEDTRSTIRAGASGEWSGVSWLRMNGRVSLAQQDDRRDFHVANGWLGGFQTRLGRMAFDSGGYQHQDVSDRSREVELGVSTRGFAFGRFTASAMTSAIRSSSSWSRKTVVYDSAFVGSDAVRNAESLTPKVEAFDNTGTDVRAGLTITRDSGWLSVGAVRAANSLLLSGRSAPIAPFAHAGIDVGRLGHVTASWSRGFGGPSPFAITGLFSGGDVSDSAWRVITPVEYADSISPERLTSFDATFAFAVGSRIAGRAGFFNQRTENLIHLIVRPDSAFPANGGSTSLAGFHLDLEAAIMRRDAGAWTARLTALRSRSRLTQMPTDTGAFVLGPRRWNTQVQGRLDQSFPVIVGSTYLRSATGDLLLSNGLPIADTSSAGMRALGTVEPDVALGLLNRFQFGRYSLELKLEGQLGGRFFSATNRLGSVSGTLETTADRVDTGLIIAGTDSATGAPNSTPTSTEAYYHALGEIAEAWVVDATFLKMREARLAASWRLPAAGPFRTPRMSASIAASNLFGWTRTPNVDPEAAMRDSRRGLELGTGFPGRSFSLQVTIVP